MFENNGLIHVYIPGAGADNTLGSKYKFSVNLVICCKFFPFNYFVTDFPIQTHRRPNLAVLSSTAYAACQVSRS